MNGTRWFLLAALVAGSTVEACSATEDDAELRTWIDVDASLPLANPSEVDGDVQGIRILFDELSLHHVELGWIDTPTSAGAIDLLDPDNLPAMLLTSQFPGGKYDQIRFGVVRAVVVVDGHEMPLYIRSGAETDVTIDVTFCLSSGRVASLDLAWNVENALHWTRRNGWWLEAEIQVRDTPSCGSDPV